MIIISFYYHSINTQLPLSGLHIMMSLLRDKYLTFAISLRLKINENIL